MKESKWSWGWKILQNGHKKRFKVVFAGNKTLFVKSQNVLEGESLIIPFRAKL